MYEGAIQKGIEKGMEQGITKGETKRNVEIVRRMKAKGYPLEEIMDCTGLSADEIGALS